METQTQLSRHYEFISAENITILFVLSDNFIHAKLQNSKSATLRKACKKSSDETVSIVIFSAKINL